ncbi:MAG TPA: endonuclease/exonuclease/phosphatase family protein [Ktedonobacteraceae bacterium]|jgi:endonuclease/exonuclease/phosphatase family metal-dependent hydrolase|nr:endonuclease/exonuclease/phosphatase family protein [Ktedonobacteraceae bacterium]
MTRIVSYNILAGGYSLRENGARRVKQLVKMIQSVDPDIVGVVEATHPMLTHKPLVIEEVAEELGMQLIMGGDAAHRHDYQLALLTRLPVVSTKLHPRPGLLNKPLMEVCVREENGEELTVFVTHLAAYFYKGWAGNGIREREIEEILQITRPHREQGIPHLIMGDFNSLAPGDRFKASNLLRYVLRMDKNKKDAAVADGHPNLNFVVPEPLRIFNPLLRIIPASPLLTMLFDVAASSYAPRGSIRKMLAGGYTDSFRHTNAYAGGFTCPAAAPAGRIDYIFSSPALIERLERCYELTGGEDIKGEHASDHLPVAAEFGIKVQAVKEKHEEKDAAIR